MMLGLVDIISVILPKWWFQEDERMSTTVWKFYVVTSLNH